jgi:hypothetical protein
VVCSGRVAAQAHDLLVMNYGLHAHNLESFSKKMVGEAVAYWGTPGFNEKSHPLMIWRETTPQHFASPTGLYHGQQDADEARALAAAEKTKGLSPDQCMYNHRTETKADNPYTELAAEIEEAGVPVLHVYDKLFERNKAKAGRQASVRDSNIRSWDCTHYCEPSLEVGLMTQTLFDKLALLEEQGVQVAAP